MQFVSFATELIAKSSLAKEFVYFFIGRIGMTMIADAAQEEVFSWRHLTVPYLAANISVMLSSPIVRELHDQYL